MCNEVIVVAVITATIVMAFIPSIEFIHKSKKQIHNKRITNAFNAILPSNTIKKPTTKQNILMRGRTVTSTSFLFEISIKYIDSYRLIYFGSESR
jgi:hypothetical protein